MMKKTDDATFEIKVAIIGNVSAGKTTVLNALFRDKYGEVSMKRTTAGVNEFVVSSPNQFCLPKEARDSKSILTEISTDNVALRTSKQVKTKRFEIKLDQSLCEIRKDTKLVIVDIPGINEANASKKYKDYVKDHWNTFDCALVVMDGRQGVNTEEQVSLLSFVKNNLNKSKDIPVMILCNKIDDPDDKEQMEMVLEAQHEVEKIFQVKDRQESLAEILQDSCSSKERRSKRMKKTPTNLSQVSPVFIPISGITAFVFQSCSSMSLEKFRHFDEDLISKLGRERIGKRRWKRLSKEEQIQQAHEAVSDPQGYQEGIEDSNFDKVLNVFSYLVSGDAVQEAMIQKQIQVSLENIQCDDDIVEQLEELYHIIVSISGSTKGQETSVKELKSTFWRLRMELEKECFATHESWKASEHFAPIAEALRKYYEFATSVGWEGEASLSIESFKKSFQRALKSTKASEGFVQNLSALYKELKALSLDTLDPSTVEGLKACFERLYLQLEKQQLKCFTRTDTVHKLSHLAEELVNYGSLAKEANWECEYAGVCSKFKRSCTTSNGHTVRTCIKRME